MMISSSSLLQLLLPRLCLLARSFPRADLGGVGPRIVPAMAPPLNLQDLREKRLRALLGEGATVLRPAVPMPLANAAKESSVVTTNGDAGVKFGSSTPPRDPSRGSAQKVIDLSFTDSSDDENEKPPPKRPRKEPAPRRRGASSPASSTKAAPSSRKEETLDASTQLSRTADSESPSSFQVVSWNVWFGPPNGSNPHVRARMSAMARILRECDDRSRNQRSEAFGSAAAAEASPPLWFVGFQEVTEEARIVLEKSLSEYTFVRQPGGAFYYCMLGVRQRGSGKDPVVLESGCVDYHRTVCGRAFCYARVRLPMSTTELLVATTHLESYCGKDYTGLEERRIQLLQFESFAKQQFGRHPHLRSCLLMGDYNWDDESKSAKLDDKTDRVLSLPSADAWLRYRSRDPSRTKETCYTYDGPRNPMLGNRLRRRFDRCVALCRDADQLPQVNRVELLGTTVLPGLTWDKVNSFTGATREAPTMISDHYGLLASLTLE